GYDSLGNLTTLTNPLSQAATLTYTATGQPLTITTAAGTTGLGYDRGDVATITDPVGNTTTRFTDDGGRLTSLTMPLGQRTRYAYDALNRLTRITDPLGGQTQLSYDPNGNLLGLTDARGGATSYAYNAMDRATTRTDPLTRQDSYGYDNNGNPTALTDRKGQGTSRVYDALDRLTQLTYQDGATTSFTWDAGNRLTQVVDSISGTVTRTYDNLDRLSQEVTPQGTVSYTYDTAGRRTSLTVLGQPAVTYTYDNADRLTQIIQGASTVTIAYDTAGRRTSLTLPNGVLTEYAWDAASRLTGLTYKNGPTALGTLTYGYDGASNRTLVSGTWARTGLPQAVASASYNAANQQVAFGGQGLTYDLNGNLTSDGATTYTWDARDRLVALAGPGVTASFNYDPLGRRLSKTMNGTTTSFLYDGLHPVQEQQGGTPTANLLTGLGLDEYLTRTDAAGAQHFLADALGSTLALADDTGTVQTTYTYEPFGATTLTGAATGNPFEYTGRENDGTGLRYYRARYYHPTRQRFISEDPIRFLGGANFYTYAANDPIGGRDPLGLCKDPGGPGLRYCMHRYIPDPTSFGIFQGDNRGADPDGGTFKSQQMLTGNGVSSCTAGESTIVGTPISAEGSVGQCDARISGRKDGGRTIGLQTTATNGLVPFGPLIETDVTIDEGPFGETSVEVSGTPYPSMEVWQYGGPGGPRLIYQYTTRGTPWGLYVPGPLPRWSPSFPP
ncbi:MAG: RHS repeat-associated core domain-containing protein, partial [Gemmatimonadales bacterium]